MAELSPMQRTDLGLLFDEFTFRGSAHRTFGTSIVILGGIFTLTGIGLTIASKPMWFLLIIAGAIVFAWGCVIWLISFREHGRRVLVYTDGFVYETSRKVTTVRWEAIANVVRFQRADDKHICVQTLQLTDGTRLVVDRSVERSAELTEAILIGYYRQRGINWDNGLADYIRLPE
jgi:hypothetical protein